MNYVRIDGSCLSSHQMLISGVSVSSAVDGQRRPSCVLQVCRFRAEIDFRCCVGESWYW